jgi:uncharacterized protein
LKLHRPPSAHLNTFTAYDIDYVEVNEVRYGHSILVAPEGPIVPWDVIRFEDLASEHFSALLEWKPEVVLFGSGARLRFAAPRLTAALHAQRVGLETMDLYAACRTYNILMSEGRKVVAALLIESVNNVGPAA